MSVLNNTADFEENLVNQFDILESKVLDLKMTVSMLETRLSKIEALAKKNGIDLKSDNPIVEGDTCTIN